MNLIFLIVQFSFLRIESNDFCDSSILLPYTVCICSFISFRRPCGNSFRQIYKTWCHQFGALYKSSLFNNIQALAYVIHIARQPLGTTNLQFCIWNRSTSDNTRANISIYSLLKLYTEIATYSAPPLCVMYTNINQSNHKLIIYKVWPFMLPKYCPSCFLLCSNACMNELWTCWF